MIQTPGLLLTMLAFVAMIGPLVFIHEMGHYWAGRLFGVKADVFSIGFGRELFGWTDKRGTRWKLGWLPLGGYVRFSGDMNVASEPSAEWLSLPAEERNRTFQAKPVWQRAIIVLAGPAINFVAAIMIFAGFALAYGDVRTPTVIGAVVPGSAAAAAGLRPGDTVATLNGRTVKTFSDIARYTAMRAGERVRVTFDRSGRRIATDVVIGVDQQVDRFGNRSARGLLGIAPAQPVIAPVSLWQAPGVGIRQSGEAMRSIVDTLGQVVTGRRSVRELGGPLSIAKTSGEFMTLGIGAFVWLMAMISINLGFINLLPVPMLDGGHLLFYAIEAVRRRPVGPEAQEWAYRGGLAALAALMLLVTINDLGAVGVWNGIGRGLAGLID